MLRTIGASNATQRLMPEVGYILRRLNSLSACPDRSGRGDRAAAEKYIGGNAGLAGTTARSKSPAVRRDQQVWLGVS